MKKLISMLLVLTMLFSMVPSAYAAEETDAPVDAECGITTGGEDLSGQLFTEMFGDGSAYQVTAVELSEDLDSAAVSYIAEGDCALNLTVIDETTYEPIFAVQVDVEAGTQTVDVPLKGRLPEYFWVDAVISQDGAACSEVFSHVDHTKEYQDFLDMTIEEAEDSDQVVLDYGENEDGQDNFVIVNEEVKIVYVDSMDDVEVLGEDDNASLFGLLNESEGYVFDEVENEEVLDDLARGDRVLILPADDVNNARMLKVDRVQENASLFGDEEGATVEVTASADGGELEEFFDVVKLDVTVEADAGDVDTDQRDADVTLVEPAEEDMTADLFASKETGKSMSKSFTVSFTDNKKIMKVTDTVSLTAKINLKIEYNTKFKIPTKLTRVVATTSLNVTNKFNIHANKSIEYKPSPKKLGTIPIGTVGGVTFTVPVYLTFYASLGSVFDYTATQSETVTVTVTYKSGSYSQKTTKSASSTKSIETEMKAVVQVGLKADVTATFLAVIDVAFGAEAGLKATATMQALNANSTYIHENVRCCVTVVLSLYAKPSFKLSLCGKKLAGKTWDGGSVTLLTFYAHERYDNSKWDYGLNNCPHRKYLVTLTVKDNKGKVISGVTVKEGSKTWGSTNKSGKLNLWMTMASHKLALTKSSYNASNVTFTVSGPVSRNVTMYKTGGANEYMRTMAELTALTDAEFAELLAAEEVLANTIFRIETKEDLADLAAFAARTDRTTKGLRFALNNSTKTLDLSEIDAWTSIGTAEKPFMGELNGNGFIITGLSGANGLFGAVEDAKIYDLTLEDVSVSGGSKVGALAGAAENSLIYDIAVNGGSVAGESNVGGIIGSMNDSELLNAYTTADVTGSSNVGGIAGSFAYTNILGQITNCYSAGDISGTNEGGVCGTLTYTGGMAAPEEEVAEDDVTDEGTDEEPAEGETSEDATYSVGIQYAYYLSDSANAAVGSNSNSVEVIAFPVTEEQANGTNDAAYIVEDGSHANTLTLLDALNNWWAANGSFTGTETADLAEEETEGETESSGTTIPEATKNDYYNCWYADGADKNGVYSNGGYPIFAKMGTLYVLTVYYVFEDGTEAHAPVILYLEEGQPYDVDSFPMEGYHYNEDAAEYAGNMPANDLEYRVIYVKDDPATGGSMTALSTDENGAEAGKSYSIATAQEMELFAAYVNAEKTTEDVTFLLNGNIEWPAGTAFTPIGTAENPFRGTFDGNYQTIMNLPNSLFGALDGAAVQNLGLSVNITGTEGKPVGAVAAVAEDSVITGCTVEAVIENTGAAGGLVGEANGTKVEQCAVTGSVQGTDAGGFIGKMTDGSVTNSSGEAAVSGSASAGGMVGTQSGTAAIRNCYATGDVTGSGSAKAGGLVGNAAGGTVENVYHSGTVTGGDAVFGAVSGAKSDSVWYSVGGTTSVSGVESFELTDAGVEALLTALNAWLMQENDESYLTWTVEAASDESADLSSEADVKLPVFGAAYTKWMTELKLEEGVVVYAFDNASCEDATICIACYAANDQMKAAFYLSVLEGELEVPAGVTYAKAFVMDQDSKPLSGAVGTA